MTFNEIWDEFISHKRKRIKPSSVSLYIAHWKMLKPFFGEYEITSITTKMVERWAIDELESVSRRTIKDRIMLLNNIIDYYDYEYEINVSRINTKYFHWPTVNSCNCEIDTIKTFSIQDIKALLVNISENPQPQNILVSIMIGTGIRIGEACALTYGSLNHENGTIEITGTLERIVADPGMRDGDYERMNVKVLHKSKSSKSFLILSTPKCASSRRAIPLPGELLKVLKKLATIFPAKYYIGTNTPKPIEPRNLRTHYYRLLESAGIDKRLSPHSLRHTYATTMMTSGVDIKTTAALLGHGDTATTLEIYSHATVESKKRAMTNTIGKQFKDALAKLK